MMSRHEKVTLVFIMLSFIIFFSFFQDSLSTTLLSTDVEEAFSFSLENGFYQDDIQIGMSLSSRHLKRMQIRYTLDGSTPDASSPLYTAPLFYPAEDTVQVIPVKAIVCDQNGYLIGGPYCATYFVGKQINTWTNALVVSITSDADGLFSEKNGILYPMSDCGPTEEDWKWFEKQNCKQRGDAWIRSAHIDVFEPDGSNVISQNIGLCVDGDHGSMTHYPYSLKVLAGKEYDDAHPSFQYDIFRYSNIRGTQFAHIQDFNNMVFRNGGNEYNAGTGDPQQRGTMLRWNIGNRLADEAGYMTAGARPAMVFLNGEFYCVAQLQDTYNRHNTGARTLLDKNRIEIYKDSEKACTEDGGYQNLYYSYPDIASSPILSVQNQRELEEIVSLDDMFSYYAFELLLNNTDYPKKNYAIWRYTGEPSDTIYDDGKFRFLINDLDCTWDFRYDDDLWTAFFHHIKEDGTLMGSLIQVDDYKNRFLNIVCDLMNSGLFDREHLEQIIDEADSGFHLIASHYYTPEDEAKRQQNVLLLKESAFARKEKIRGFIQDTFHPLYPYTLLVKAPENGACIQFSTTQLISSDNDFQGAYYGDYPMTLSASFNDCREFFCWKINGKSIFTPNVTLDASLIENGEITVELLTSPTNIPGELLISEVCANENNAWIELYNASENSVDLGSYALANDVPVHFLKFRLPDIVLAPGETFIAGTDNEGAFRLMPGENVFLIKESTVQDSLSVPVMAQTESYARFGETNEWRYYATPTPGAIN